MNEKFKKIAEQSLKEADERKKSNQQMKKKKESRDLTGSRLLFLIHRPIRRPYGVNVEW